MTSMPSEQTVLVETNVLGLAMSCEHEPVMRRWSEESKRMGQAKEH